MIALLGALAVAIVAALMFAACLAHAAGDGPVVDRAFSLVVGGIAAVWGWRVVADLVGWWRDERRARTHVAEPTRRRLGQEAGR